MRKDKWHWDTRSAKARKAHALKIGAGLFNHAPGAYGALDIDEMHRQEPYKLMMAAIEERYWRGGRA